MDCKPVDDTEEFVILITSSSSANFYARTRFSLLSSSWLPLPVGVIPWSVLHLLLVLSVPLLLLVSFTALLALAILLDALILLSGLYLLLLLPVIILSTLLGFLIWTVVKWAWSLLSRDRRRCTTAHTTTPPPQGPLPQVPPHPDPVVADHRCCSELLEEWVQHSIAVTLLKNVGRESVPYWRGVLGNWCREVVPLYDTIAI